MKKLTYKDETFEAEEIIKGNDFIVGLTLGREIFSFRGISDFAEYSLEHGQEFDNPEPSEKERIASLESERIALQMALAEAIEKQEIDKVTNQLALAELMDTLTIKGVL